MFEFLGNFEPPEPGESKLKWLRKTVFGFAREQVTDYLSLADLFDGAWASVFSAAYLIPAVLSW